MQLRGHIASEMWQREKLPPLVARSVPVSLLRWDAPRGKPVRWRAPPKVIHRERWRRLEWRSDVGRWVYRFGAILPSLPTFQAVGTSQSGAGALTVAWPTHATSDVALLVVCAPYAATPPTIALTTANGFAAVGTQQNSTGATGAAALAVFWARATSSSMSSPVVGAQTTGQYARIYTFRGVSKDANPWDVTANGTNDGTGSTTPSVAGATTTFSTELVAAIVAYNVASNTAQLSAPTNSGLGSVTLQGDQSTTTNGGAGLITGTLSAGGVYGATTATLATSSKNACMSIAFRPQWAVDATSGVAVPRGINEWADFATGAALTWLVAPDHLYLCQEAASPLGDFGSGTAVTLAGGGSGLSYGNAVAGWSLLAVKTTDASAGRWSSSSTSLPDLSTTSALLMALAQNTTTPIATRGFVQMGTPSGNRVALDISTTPSFRSVSDGNTGAASATNIGTSAVHCSVIRSNNTLNTTTTFYEGEALPVPTRGTVSGKFVSLGGQATTSGGAAIVYAPMWVGTPAEMTNDQVHALMVAMGFTVTWGANSEDFWTDSLITIQAQLTAALPWTRVVYDTIDAEVLFSFGVDEESISVPQPTRTPWAFVVSDQNVDDPVMASESDEAPFVPPRAQASPWNVAVETYDDVPAGQLSGQPDEDHPAPLAAWRDLLANGVYAFNDPDEIATGGLRGQPDEDMPAPLAVFSSIRATDAYGFDDPEEIPAGLLHGQPDEDHVAPVATFAALSPQATYIFNDFNDPPAGQLSGQPDEDHVAPVATFTPSISLLRHLFDDLDETPAGLLNGQPDEDWWTSNVKPAVGTIFQVLPIGDVEEIPTGNLFGVIDDSICIEPARWNRLFLLQTIQIDEQVASLVESIDGETPNFQRRVESLTWFLTQSNVDDGVVSVKVTDVDVAVPLLAIRVFGYDVQRRLPDPDSDTWVPFVPPPPPQIIPPQFSATLIAIGELVGQLTAVDLSALLGELN